MRFLFFGFAALSLAACDSVPTKRSAYPSGWNLDVSLEKHRQCGMVRFAKGTYIEHNLELLIDNGYLTQEQATRARNQDVRVGDPECVAYAAFGMSESLNTQSRDASKRLISVRMDFRCEMSPTTCPGQRIVVADGHVVSKTPIVQQPAFDRK